MSLRGLFSIRRGLAIAIASLALAGCQYDAPKDLKPVSSALKMKMEQLGMSEIAPIYIRIFKEESEFEIWKKRDDGKYALLKTYDICKWSGVLGPKKAEGDRQAPEGYYTVTPAQMNPNSSYYLSFDIGYPNNYDRALGRTGANLMVHGACSSRGCYSMTDDIAGEIFALARDSFRGGQRSFSLAAYPFRMTPENMARHRNDPNMPFWRMLKDGYDHFEVTQAPPKVDVCGKRYVFNADAGASRFNASAACPAFTVPEDIRVAVAAKQQTDEAAYKVALVKVEEDEARKTAEAERRKAADERAVAAAQEYEAKQAAAKEAATATPAKLSLAEEGAAPEEKKGRFSAFKRWLGGLRGNRDDKPATTASTATMASEFDAGTGPAAPIPVPRPSVMASRPAASEPAKKEATAKPVAAPAAAPAAAEVPPPKPAVIADEPPATEPEKQQAETPPAPAAEPAPRPATASTRTPEKPAATTPVPASTPPQPEKTGKPNFDDVFG